MLPAQTALTITVAVIELEEMAISQAICKARLGKLLRESSGWRTGQACPCAITSHPPSSLLSAKALH